MQKLFVVVLLATGIISCSSPDKKAELEALKKQAIELKSQIEKLESEIASTDTSSISNEKIKTVSVESIKQDTFLNYIEVQGKVDADENVSLSPEMGGSVERIYVKVGDEVSVGQILVELDNKMIVNGIAELKNGLELATIVYEKQKNLWDQKIGTEIQFLSAKNQKESLEKKLATLNEQLEMSRVKSPINGVVDAVDTKIGQIAAPGYPIVRVVNFSNLKVEADVPETYASRVKKGNPVMVIFPDMQDTIKTSVTFSAKVINAVNRTFEVQVNLDNKREYHPNMVSILKIVDYSNNNAIVVPVKVIQHANEGDFVFIEEGNKAKKVLVKTGKMYNGKAEILSGLKASDKLITGGYQDLNEGEPVKVEKAIL
ncbi:MAG: efflux RND transporter periplasmic adaptor subunit [Bacteroidetes bacterium]|nr:efflux RND transporter periplasmic adaptor subunit [Bacteroidota bacterium]